MRPLNRRDLLFGAVARLRRRLEEAPSGSACAEPVRPPGALPEAAFRATCQRCHRCIAACPNGVLGALHGQGEAIEATPYMACQDGYCQRCRACAEACPSGALRPEVTGAAAYPGLAVVNMGLCLNSVGVAMCLACQDHCPEGAITLVQLRTPRVDESLCTGCGACLFVCPTSPKTIALHPRQDRPLAETDLR